MCVGVCDKVYVCESECVRENFCESVFMRERESACVKVCFLCVRKSVCEGMCGRVRACDRMCGCDRMRVRECVDVRKSMCVCGYECVGVGERQFL